MLCVLLEFSITETGREVKIEVLDAISKAAVFQKITNINFYKFLENLDNTPEECLSRCIDILSFTQDALSSNNKKISQPSEPICS